MYYRIDIDEVGDIDSVWILVAVGAVGGLAIVTFIITLFMIVRTKKFMDVVV